MNKLANIREENFWVSKIELLWYGDIIGTATGFFYKHAQTLGLVTNWHVFSNRHATTGIHLRTDQKIPNEVRFVASIVKAEVRSHGVVGRIIEFREYTVPLIRDGKTLWWQHFGYKSSSGEVGRVDIAVLPLDSVQNGLAENENIFHFAAYMILVAGPEGEFKHADYAYPRVGADVFILGYPRGLTNQGLIPTWKRGSIASEPLAHLDNNLPAFLVDSVTREGMSGAPILYFGSDITTSDGIAVGPEVQDKTKPWLIGIHAGSRGSSREEIEMTLSRGWKRHLIDEVFMCQFDGDAEPTGESPWSYNREGP